MDQVGALFVGQQNSASQRKVGVLAKGEAARAGAGQGATRGDCSIRALLDQLDRAAERASVRQRNDNGSTFAQFTQRGGWLR